MKIGVKIAIGFALGLIMIATLGIVSYETILHQIEGSRQVMQAHDVMENLEAVMSLVTTAETGERGFIITGRESYLAPQNSATGQLERRLATLADLTADNPEQQESLRQVGRMIEERLALLKEGIRIRREQGLDAAVQAVLTDRGKRSMDAIRSLISEMEVRERLLLARRTRDAEAGVQRTVWTILIGVPLSFLILTLAAFVITRHIARPLETIAFAARRISWGDLSVALPHLRRRDEVGVLRESFLQMIAWLRQMSDAADRIARRDLTVSIRPQSDRDELGHSFSIMVENLRAMTDEIQRRSEELALQNEELAHQSEELTSQNEEIQALNRELNSRGRLLQKLLDSARLSGTEEGIMREVSKAAIDMFGQAAAAVIVYEKVGSELLIRATAGIDEYAGELRSRPAEHTFADEVIRENQTAWAGDMSRRPDISVLRVPGREPFQSILCAPVAIRGQATGAFAVYGAHKQEWTAEQSRLAEWLAAQCAHALETLRLQNDLRRQAELIDLSPDAILVRAADGAAIQWGRGAESLYGWSREEVLGREPHALLNTRFPEPPERIHQHLHGAGQWSGELTQSAKDGREVIVQSRWLERPAKSGGDGAEILESNVDITERKQTEQALRDAHDELERRVRARTSELQRAYEELMEETREREQLEDQLRQSQKMEAIGTLAGGVAHDFNNMLAAIIGNAELALDDMDSSAPPRRNVERILTASGRAAELVKQILTFSRSRKGDREKKTVRLIPLVEETFKLLRGSLPSTIRMDLEVKTESDTILGDGPQIQQVLVNLATNAAYAMREKGGSLLVSLEDVSFLPGDPAPDRDMAPGPYAKLTVTDTGAGMTADILKRVFEPFFTTKDVGEGTGMGLPVVYGIVKSHDGAITAESMPGKGSVFTVYLPHGTQVPGQEETEEGEGIPGGRERILVVDDEPLVVEMVAATLGRLGYAVTAASSGAEALSEFLRKPEGFDLVLTDQTMPDITGIDLAQRMLQTRRDMPIVLFTGYSETVSAETAKAAGIREFVMKPVEKREVAATVRRVLDNARGP